MPIPSRIYWDTSCFVSLLNAREAKRADACRDVLNHAQAGAVQIWTSTLTIAEVIRPKRKYEPAALPGWVSAFQHVDGKGGLLYPNAQREFEAIWHFYKRQTTPSQQLAPEIIRQIKGMFAWDYIHLIQVTPAIAQQASDISRETGLKPTDAVHTASAVARKCETLQRFDKHFDKVAHLIDVSEPVMLTQPPPLFAGVAMDCGQPSSVEMGEA